MLGRDLVEGGEYIAASGPLTITKLSRGLDDWIYLDYIYDGNTFTDVSTKSETKWNMTPVLHVIEEEP